MSNLSVHEISIITLFLEGFFYGVYSGIYAIYFQYHWQALEKSDKDKKKNIIFYSISALYVLSMALFATDIASYCNMQGTLSKPTSELQISFVQTTTFGCYDLIAQFILIYRCWIVWSCNIRVVIIPSILASAFLVVWLAGGGSNYISSGGVEAPTWGDLMVMSALVLSLAVNALVTGLIVFRIFRVFQQVRAGTSNDQILGNTGGSKLRSVILILVESGMALFAIQLIRILVSIIKMYVGSIAAPETDIALNIIVAIHEMLTGITPTIILVRTSMGLSFHDEKSMEEVAIGSLRFVSTNHSDSVEETRSIDIVDWDIRDDDIDMRRSNDIETVQVER